jgi:hypothetical protein
MHASLTRPILHNLGEMAAKVRHFGPKARWRRQSGAKSASESPPEPVHPVANAMHQKHGDLAAPGVKSVQIKSSRV